MALLKCQPAKAKIVRAAIPGGLAKSIAMARPVDVELTAAIDFTIQPRKRARVTTCRRTTKSIVIRTAVHIHGAPGIAVTWPGEVPLPTFAGSTIFTGARARTRAEIRAGLKST